MLFGGFLWPLPADLSAQVTDSLGGGFAGYLMTDSVLITTLYYLYLIVIIWYVYGGLSSLVGIHARFQEELWQAWAGEGNHRKVSKLASAGCCLLKGAHS